MPLKAPDLTQRPPRSPRVRLGGYALLPRILDKGRAAIAGTLGEYKYNCPLDQRFFEFAGITADALKQKLATGKGDGEILAWLTSKSKTKPQQFEIDAWSAWQERRTPSEIETREYYSKLQSSCGPKREDIATWFDLLDLDDYVSFGGQA